MESDSSVDNRDNPHYWGNIVPVEVSKTYADLFNISRLLPAQKKLLWAHVRQHHADLAELLSCEMFSDLQAQFFGSDILIDRKYLPQELLHLDLNGQAIAT